MPARKQFNQLDPFGENEEGFQTRSIRNSRSRSNKNPFTNVSDEKESKSNKSSGIIYAIIAIIILAGVVLLLTLPRTSNSDPTISEDPLVNPSGREATSEYSSNTNDPELREREQNKLKTLVDLILAEDWEYANATFETIFPDYLDACGRYEYYRSAALIYDHIENFSISIETAENRMNYLIEKCDRAGNE